MTETLLSPSNVLLFGRKVEDLQIVDPVRPARPLKPDLRARVVSTAPVDITNAPASIDGVPLATDDRVLLVGQQTDQKQNGISKFVPASGTTPAKLTKINQDLPFGTTIRIKEGSAANIGSYWQSTAGDGDKDEIAAFVRLTIGGSDPRHSPFSTDRAGSIGQIEGQIGSPGRCFARIYGFSFEGTYYELVRPALFLVHGDGLEASEYRTSVRARANRARAPGDPSLIGIAAADFEFADDLRVWSYDKSDYTIRMDVETGMFEDILIDPFFGGDGGSGVSGARVSGARVSGARVSGARVSGARVSGARLSGGRGDAGD